MVKKYALSEEEKKQCNTKRDTYGHGEDFDKEPIPIPIEVQADPQED